MGEVYKAKDTRLERTVAIKVLPTHLSSSEEVRQRFEREAKTISLALAPAHLRALRRGNQDGVEYLVMEYLEGETLADRLLKGPLPAEQTLRYGIEIADALDKAHRQGIVHRDLKPGNVMLTKSGVKLLDFGLAKMVEPVSQAVRSDFAAHDGARAEPDAGRDDPRDVPVHGAGAARRQGSRCPHGHLRLRRGPLRDGDGPEGLRGNEPGLADLRDHEGGAGAHRDAPADDAAGARARGPDLSRQGPRGPVAERARHQERARLDRAGRLAGGRRRSRRRYEPAPRPRGLARPSESSPEQSSRPPYPGRCCGRGPPSPQPVTRAAIPMPGRRHLSSPTTTPRSPFLPTDAGSFTSGAGRTRGSSSCGRSTRPRQFPSRERKGRTRPSSRRTASGSASGRSAGSRRFRSPEERRSRSATAACYERLLGGSWAPDDTIVFTRKWTGGLFAGPRFRRRAEARDESGCERGEPRAHLAGGPARRQGGPLHDLHRRKPGRLRPRRVPSRQPASERSWSKARRTDAMPRRDIFSTCEAAPSSRVPFDLGRLELSGVPAAVAQGVYENTNGGASYAVSSNGTLLYASGGMALPERSLLWVDRSGGSAPGHEDRKLFQRPARFPRRQAHRRAGPGGDLRYLGPRHGPRHPDALLLREGRRRPDLVAGWQAHRLRVEPGRRLQPLRSRLRWERRGGAADFGLRTTRPPVRSRPTGSFSSTTRSASGRTRARSGSIHSRSRPSPRPFLQGQFRYSGARLSPDGSWLAYESNESGKVEVYVTEFPGPGGKWQISTEGGRVALWAPDGREIFYRKDKKILRVAVTTSPAFLRLTPGDALRG